MDLGSSSEEGQVSTSSSEQIEDELLQFVEVKSKRGAPLLTRDGFEYQYEKNSSVGNQMEYWKCPRVC